MRNRPYPVLKCSREKTSAVALFAGYGWQLTYNGKLYEKN